MAQGWKIVAQLSEQDPDEPICQEKVAAVCHKLEGFNNQQKKEVVELLRNNRYGKWANGVQGEYKNDEKLFNQYFSNKIFSPFVPQTPVDKLDGARSAFLFYLSYDLQKNLMQQLIAIPSANILYPGKQDFTNQEKLNKVYRFVELHQLIRAIKLVQYDLEDFVYRTKELLEGKSLTELCSIRAPYWPSDAETMSELVLLGFQRTSDSSLINSSISSSPVVAAGTIRAHLESLLFRTDFHSSLTEFPVQSDQWREALNHHKGRGRLTNQHEMWIIELYGLLSLALHAGLLLSRGEIWMFIRLVKVIGDVLKSDNIS